MPRGSIGRTFFDLGNPLNMTRRGHVRGSLAPDGAVLKTEAASPALLKQQAGRERRQG